MTEPRRIHANGIDFAYLEAGPADGPLALCLHGFPDHAPTWRFLAPDLAAAGFHVVMPWMRGYAPTGLAADGNYQMGSVGLDALALADALAGDGDAVLIGHDWGALGSYVAVNHRPERFRKVVTLAVPHPGALGQFLFEPEILKPSWYQFFFQLPVADIVVPLNDFAVIDTLWRDWSPGYTPDPEDMRAIKETLSAPGSLTAAIDYYRFVYGTKVGDPALDAVQASLTNPTTVPALYFQGIDDGLYPPRVAEAVPPLFAGGVEVVLVEDAGHFLHLEQPQVVNPRIVEFLAS